MKKLIMGLTFLLAPMATFALDYEHYIGGGLNLDTYKSDLPSDFELEDDFTFAPTVGYKGVILWGNVGLRSGAFLEYKKLDINDDDATDGDDDANITAYYAAFPVNLQFNLNEMWAIFGGYMPRVLLTDTCDNCGGFDEDSERVVNYTNFGISVAFNEEFSMDVNFQHPLSDNYDDVKISTAQVLFLYQL